MSPTEQARPGEFGDLLRDAHRAVNELDRLRAENERLRALLRRALRSHDAIVAAYRAGGRRTPGKAIDDMHAVKAAAVGMECYPAPSSILRAEDSGRSEGQS